MNDGNLSELKAQMKKSKRRQAASALLLISPYVIIFVIFTLIPFVMGFIFSFFDYNPYKPGEMQFVWFKNYINIFNPDHALFKEWWSSFATMLLFTAVMVPTMIILPLFLAYFVNFKPPMYKFFRAIIYLPSIVSISIVGIIFGGLFGGNEAGFVNALFGTNIQWLSGQPFENDFLRWFVMFLAAVWGGAGGNFVIFSGALRDVPKSLYEACEMDGGGRWKSLLYVTLPNIKPAINICLFNTLIGYLNLYGQPYVINALDNEELLVSPMMFIQHYLASGFYSSITGYICAVGIVFGAIVMIFSSIERRVMSDRRKAPVFADECRSYIEFKSSDGSINDGIVISMGETDSL